MNDFVWKLLGQGYFEALMWWEEVFVDSFLDVHNTMVNKRGKKMNKWIVSVEKEIADAQQANKGSLESKLTRLISPNSLYQ